MILVASKIIPQNTLGSFTFPGPLVTTTFQPYKSDLDTKGKICGILLTRGGTAWRAVI